MLRLLAQRASVLFLRPAAILAEGLFVPGGNILIFVLPIAALALTMSSVPVYLDFMRTTEHHLDRREIERNYISSLLMTTLLALVILAFTLSWTRTGGVLFLSILATFVVEKFADELTRFYEFKRQYNRWFLTQLWRSVWLFIPMALAFAAWNYRLAFLGLATLTALGAVVQFFLATKLRPAFDRKGWSVIRSNSPFLGSSALLAVHRQAPRIAVAHFFPHYAHAFQAISQIGQGASLLFNVRFQIPYRKLIARRTVRFERVFRHIFQRLAVVAVALMTAAILVLGLAGYVGMRETLFFAALGFAMVADALVFSLFSAYLGYLPWFVRPSSATVTLALDGALFVLIFGLAFFAVQTLGGSLVIVPVATTLLSLASIALIRYRHFFGNRHD